MQAFLQARQQKEKQGALLAEIWQLSITEGIMGAIHGQFNRIEELYVPALDLVVNLEGNMNVFFSDGNRYKRSKSGFSGREDPKLVKTVILEGAQAEHIRNLAEIHLLFKGIKKDAKDVVENILSTK